MKTDMPLFGIKAGVKARSDILTLASCLPDCSASLQAPGSLSLKQRDLGDPQTTSFAFCCHPGDSVMRLTMESMANEYERKGSSFGLKDSRTEFELC